MRSLFSLLKNKLKLSEVSDVACVCGWEASGSTLLFQIIKLLGIEVTKEHGYIGNRNYRIKLFTIRDPRDIILSNAKRQSKSIWESEGPCAAIKKELDRFCSDKYPESYYLALKDPYTFIIKYETFINGNEEMLVKILAAQFGVPLNEENIKYILKETSIKKNKVIAKAYEDFSTWDKRSLIHGNHVSNDGKSGGWHIYFDKELTNYSNNKIGSLLRHIGYEQ